MTNHLGRAINCNDGDSAASIIQQHSASKPTTW